MNSAQTYGYFIEALQIDNYLFVTVEFSAEIQQTVLLNLGQWRTKQAVVLK
jgi:hypothetical protein